MTIAETIVENLTRMETMPPQLWVDWHGIGHQPGPEVMSPVGTGPKGRPAGGLWTSTIAEGPSSAYADRMRTLLGDAVDWHHRPAWLLHPEPARIWTVEDRCGEMDLLLLGSAHASSAPTMWGRIADHVDAIHMTADGCRAFIQQPDSNGAVGALRLPVAAYLEREGMGCPLDWWEAESTLWTRWRFTHAERLQDMHVPEIPT